MTDSGGVTVVMNHTVAPASGCVTISADPGTIIGPQGVDSAPPLYDVRGGAVLHDGRIVVLNAGSRELLYYAADGRLEKAVGGAGRGPGEFIGPTWLGHTQGDTLLVWDDLLSRVTRFDASGSLVSSLQVGFENATGASPAIGGRFVDGTFLVMPGPLVYFSGSERGVTRFRLSYQRYDPGSGRATLITDGQSPELVVADGGAYSLPFGKTEHVAVRGNTLLLADNRFASFRFFDLHGRLQRVAGWVSDPVAVTTADESAYRQHAKTRSARPPPPGVRQFAEDRPRFSGIEVDRAGWIWVRMYAAPWEPAPPWFVFDGTGVLQCRVDTHDRIAVLEIGADYLLGLRTDADGEESVLRFDLRRVGGQTSPAAFPHGQ